MLDEIYAMRTELTRILTNGVDAGALDTLTEALLRMKANLNHEAQAARRSAEIGEAAAREAV
jgi:hypothetical protein